MLKQQQQAHQELMSDDGSDAAQDEARLHTFNERLEQVLAMRRAGRFDASLFDAYT